jgi:hypothetical protein
LLLPACQLAPSSVLLIAASGKLAYPQQFWAALQMSSVPRPLVILVAVSAIVCEPELASALLFRTAWSLPVALLEHFCFSCRFNW